MVIYTIGVIVATASFYGIAMLAFIGAYDLDKNP